MFLAKIFHASTLFLLMGSLHLAKALPVREWEGTFEKLESETSPHKGLAEKPPIPDKRPYSPEVVSEKPRRSEVNSRGKRVSLKRTPINTTQDIKDETATTGENAKKRLPSSLKPKAPPQPSFMPDIHQAIHPTDFLQLKPD